MLKLIKNARLYKPEFVGYKDILISGKTILDIQDKINISGIEIENIDAQGKIVTPGFIDQHIHISGAGGKHGFSSMTPEIVLSELVTYGNTTVVGMLGTDGSARSVYTLFGKTKALEAEGISAYMHTGYFCLPPHTLTNTVQNDLIFIDNVLGCKLAISDERSSFPTKREILNLLRQVRVGGMLGGKKGILHIHLGGLNTLMTILLDIVNEQLFPIEHISPTHCSRNKLLFDQAIEFAKLGGMVDITTGGTTFDAPFKVVLYALENGVSIDNLTFSSDGNAGLDKKDDQGNSIGFRKAPIDKNLEEIQQLIKTKEISISDALKLVTTNPSKNLGLEHKGGIEIGKDADFCFLDDSFNLLDVISQGKIMMKDQEIITKGAFEI